MRIAVIGSGISGLSAAYYLSRSHEVTVFEREGQIGGHTYTVTLQTSQGELAVDMGFIVHNDRTYPNLIRLFTELGVKTQPSDMSFGVFDRATGFEYSSRGLGGFFAQRKNLLRSGHYRLLRDILRFNREALQFLTAQKGVPHPERLTMGKYLARGGYGAELIYRYLYPMASAVWSMQIPKLNAFPATTLIRFFGNHGMLGINTHPQWRTVAGGSGQYLAPLTAPFKERIRLNARIRSVSRTDADISIHQEGKPPEVFDQVVFACHGNQVLPLLDGPTDNEREILGAFQTSRNEACLHTDEALLPKRPAAQAAWNYLLSSEPGAAARLTYNMNRLQSLDTPDTYCVTLNATDSIDPRKILRQVTFHHPLYDAPAIQAQQRWGEISGQNRTHFCGAYWFYGFHEDGLNSGLRVAKARGMNR